MYEKWLRPDGLTNNPNITGFFVWQHSECAFCRYRKELYKKKPKECSECGFLSDRNKPNFVASPVWKEGYNPSSKELKTSIYFDKEKDFYEAKRINC